MLSILSPFGKSPFTPLQLHLDRTAYCVNQLPLLFEALEKQDAVSVEALAEDISKAEHEADLIKNDLRNHLPRSLMLPIQHDIVLSFLHLQDKIADSVQDIAILTTLRPLTLLPEFREEFHLFLKKNISAFEKVRLIMRELHGLIEASFGGIEAVKVRKMIEEVAFYEHEADLIQRLLLKKLFLCENTLTYGAFNLWQKIFENIAALSNLSENLAYRVLTTLEHK